MGRIVNFSDGDESNVISLYDFNKTNMAQIKPYDPIVLNKICIQVAEDIWYNASPYWMLLCRERNDYTIFHIVHNKEELQKAIFECLNNRGYVLDITKQPDDNYEIWIRDFDTNDNVAYYLFDYNNAIIEV